jgi:hypothetical protein
VSGPVSAATTHHHEKLGDTIVYEYDVGDGWKYDLLLKGMFLSAPTINYPVCVAGERACPPEDSGGVGGYADLVRKLASPTHPEYDELLEWVGGSFDPDAFDLDKVNTLLRRTK